MIKCACGNCGQYFLARDEFAGRVGVCPECHIPLAIPGKSKAPVTSVKKGSLDNDGVVSLIPMDHVRHHDCEASIWRPWP